MTVVLQLVALYAAGALILVMYGHRDRDREPLFVAIRVTRSAISIGVVLFLAVSYGIDTDPTRGYLFGVAKYALGLLVTAPVLAILGVLLICLAPPGRRRLATRRFVAGTNGVGPVTVLLATGGSFALAYVVFAARPWNLGNHRLQILTILLWLIFLVPFVFLTIVAPALALTSMFNAGAAHPLLPALAGPWFALAAALLNTVSGIDSVINTPATVKGLLTFGALVALVGLSGFEYRYLTRRRYASLRSGPVA